MIYDSEDDCCLCANYILKGRKFEHYDEKLDRLGSEFDDFGITTYKLGDGSIIKVHTHVHLGLYYSYSHDFEDVPSNAKKINFEKNNDVIQNIKPIIMNDLNGKISGPVKLS